MAASKRKTVPVEAVVDPDPVPAEPSAPAPVLGNVRIRAKSSGHANAGGAHYTLKAGAIMVVTAQVAADLIAQRLAEEV